MRNSDYASHLTGTDFDVATKLDIPIEEMSDKHLRAVGFSQSAVETIEAVGEDKPWLPLTRINGVGPETAKEINYQHAVNTVEGLRDLLERRDSLNIDNEAHIRRSIEWVGEGRIELEKAHDIVEAVHGELDPYFEKLKAVGSYRRSKDTVGDIDMLGVPDSPTSDVQNAFKEVCDYTIRCGEKKMTGRFQNTQLDIQIVNNEQWPAALQYFTGSQEHNIKLRRCAKEDALKLNEYGLWDRETEERVKVESEEQLYQMLLGEYIPPENRH